MGQKIACQIDRMQKFVNKKMLCQMHVANVRKITRPPLGGGQILTPARNFSIAKKMTVDIDEKLSVPSPA